MKRNPIGVWLGLPMITLGIYTLFWYFKINGEAKRYLRDPSINPGSSLLAITLGGFLIVPPYMSVHGTAERILRMQQNANVAEPINPTLAVVLMFCFGLHTFYLQSNLNKVWDAHRLAMPAAAPVAPPLPAV
jgi:hypothetical protein